MTMGELRELVLSWLDDPNAGYFTPEQVDAWLNLGQKEVQKKLVQSGELWWAIPVSSNTVASVNEYSLPTDFMRLHKFQIIVSGTFPNATINPLVPVTPMQVEYFPQGTGLPSAYWIRKNCVVLAKVPDNIYTMLLLYSPQIAPLTADSQTPDMPDRYQEAIALEACQAGFLKDQRDPNPIFSMKWDGYMKMLAEDSQDRNVDVPREVVVTQFDGSQAWGY